MNLSFGTNIRINISDETSYPSLSVTIAGLPAGVDLEKSDFMQGPDAEEPQFGDGRLLCKDGSFVTDGRPFTITFKSGKLVNAIFAAGVLAKHIIAPIRIKPVPDSAGDCICSCMPAGLQIGKTLISLTGYCTCELPGRGMDGDFTDGDDLLFRIQVTVSDNFTDNKAKLAESFAALSLADALFF